VTAVPIASQTRIKKNKRSLDSIVHNLNKRFTIEERTKFPKILCSKGNLDPRLRNLKCHPFWVSTTWLLLNLSWIFLLFNTSDLGHFCIELHKYVLCFSACPRISLLSPPYCSLWILHEGTF
jgi:hypothetical protein